MKKTKILVISIVLSLFILNIVNISAMPYTDMDNWLTLSKNTTGPRYIVNSKDEPFQMFGMARCQITAPLDEDPKYDGINGLCDHFKKLGMNSIRLAISTFNQIKPKSEFIEECGGYNEAGINKFIDQYVDPDVQTIIKNGMYVVLDLHEYPPAIPKGDPDPDLILKYAREHYIPIWRELAKRYKDEPMVAMYELWNEPYAADQGSMKIGGDGKISGGIYKGYDWNENVRQFFIDCVKEVRKTDTRHMILVSDFNAGWGAGWPITWRNYADKIDPVSDNVLYSAHANGSHLLNDTLVWDYKNYIVETAAKNNICIQFGEVETEEENATVQSMKDFIDFLDKTANINHFSAFLWRPHNTDNNNYDYASVWSEFAKKYNSKPLYTDAINSSSKLNSSLNDSNSSDKTSISVKSNSSSDGRISVESYTSVNQSSSISGDNNNNKNNTSIIVLCAILGLLILGSLVFFTYKKKTTPNHKEK